MNPRRRSSSPSLPLSLAIAVLLVGALEFFLFDHFGARRVTGIYPRWNDQIQYLSESYTGYEHARAHGLAAGLWTALVNPSAQGTLHDVLAIAVFQAAGPSRSAALALNMLALMAWQLALFVAVDRRTGQRWLAVAAAMLPLALHGPWQDIPGSAYDFRLDHLAMCALGVTSAVGLLTDGFRSRGWSIALGAAAGVTLLTRFLTGTYLVLVFVAFLVWALLGWSRKRRVLNLMLAAIVAAAIAGPIFWLNREWVWNYYYIGHYVGPESAVRNQNFGLAKSLAFVWGGLAERHLGVFIGVFAAGMATVLGAIRVLEVRRIRVGGTDDGTGCRVRDLLIVGAAYLLAPAVVLTLHPQKSDVVLSALVPGAMLLCVAAWLAAAGGITTIERTPGATYAIAATVGALAVLAYFGQRQFASLVDPETRANLGQINGIADEIFARSEAAKIERPRVAVDHITDALDAQVLRVICYERHRVWKNFEMTLPTGIAEPAADLVRRRVAESDFVFLVGDDAPFGSYPFDRKLQQLRPELRAWCEANLRPAKRFILSGRELVLWEAAPRAE